MPKPRVVCVALCHADQKSPRLLIFFLPIGVNVNATEFNWCTAIHLAILTPGCPRLLEAVLEAGADTTLKLNGMAVLLHMAAKSTGRVRALKRLLDHGADIEAVDGKGLSPLRLVTEEAVVLLLECGADVNATDRSGQTKEPKWWVTLFLEYGAEDQGNKAVGYGRTVVLESNGKHDVDLRYRDQCMQIRILF